MDPSAPLPPGDELTPSSLLIDVGSGGLPPVQCREIEEDVEEEDVKDFQMKNKGTKRPVLREATAATYDSKCKTMTTFMSDTSRGFDPQHQSDSETQDRRGDILSVDLLTLKRNSLAGGLLSTHGRARESRKSSRVHFCINPLTSSIVAAALSTTGGELDSDILSDGSGEYSRSSATSARVRYRLVTASSLEATALHSSIGETEDSAASRAAKTQRKVSFCDPHLGTIVPAGDPQNDSNSGSDASDTEVKGGDESADNDGDVSSGDPEPGSEGKESGGKWSHAASQGDGKKHAKVKIKNKYRNRARPISPPSFAKGNAGRHVTIHGPSNPEGEGGHIGRTDVPSSVTDEAGSTPTLPGLTLTAKDSLSQLFDKENVKRANEEEDDSLNVGIFSGSRVTVRPIPDLPHCSYEISMGMLKQHTIYQVDFVLPNQLGAARVELLRRSSWLDEAARLAAASSLPACSTMDVLDEFGASRDEELDEEERGDELEAEEECSEDKFGDEDWHNGRQSVEDYGIAPVGDKLLVGDSDHTESKNSQMEASPASVVGSSEHSINPCSVLDQPAAVDLIDLSSGVSAEDLSPTDHSETSTTFSHAQSLIVSPSASCPTKPTKHQGVAPIPIYSGFRIGAEVELLECEYSPTLEGHRMSLKVSTSDVRRIAEAFVLRKINRPHENVHLYLIGVTLGKGEGTPSLRRGIHKCGHTSTYEDSDAFTEWQGFEDEEQEED